MSRLTDILALQKRAARSAPSTAAAEDWQTARSAHTAGALSGCFR